MNLNKVGVIAALMLAGAAATILGLVVGTHFAIHATGLSFNW